MGFISLGIVFIFSGLLGILYYSLVPQAELLRKRLPNKVTPASIVLTLAIGALIWFLVLSEGGIPPVSKILAVIFALLVFESVFLVSMHWIRINIVAVVVSVLLTGLLFWYYFASPHC